MSYVSPIIETTAWKAWANLRPPAPFSLHVTGKVKLRSGDHEVELVQVAPDGSDSRSTLLLRIIVTGAGATDDIAEKDVSFVLEDYKSGTYKNVEILSSIEKIGEIEEAH